MKPVNVPSMTAAQARAVEALVTRATAADGVGPLSEQALLNARPEPGSDGEPDTGITHLLLPSPPDAEADGDHDTLIGYAQIDARPGGAAAAELVVDPQRRRQGHGGRLLDTVLAGRPDLRVWSHGLLPGAAELAATRGLVPVRELLKMARPVRPTDAFATELPPGYTVTTYSPDAAPDWLAANAAAFATHAEQGRMTPADLRAREAEPWFDPAGFFLVRDPAGALAAFHWTKIEHGVGEVYVVGVAPTQQGRGLGRAVTAIGLAHLRDAGVAEVELYVDGDNTAAVATYERQGFRTVTRDVQFARRVSR